MIAAIGSGADSVMVVTRGRAGRAYLLTELRRLFPLFSGQVRLVLAWSVLVIEEGESARDLAVLVVPSLP